MSSRGRPQGDGPDSTESGPAAPDGEPEPAAASGGRKRAPDVERVVAPALELAVVVARGCEEQRPPLPVPKRLRTLSRFAKLPPTARHTVHSVLDEDEEFRRRVAAAGAHVELPRASWLFLNRPQGWEDELEEHVTRAAEEGEASEADRGERAAKRRLAGAEAAVGRLETALAAARAETERAVTDAADERRARRQIEEAMVGLERRLQAAIADLEGRIEDVTAQLDTARRRVHEQAAELDGLRTQAAEPAASGTDRAPAAPPRKGRAAGGDRLPAGSGVSDPADPPAVADLADVSLREPVDHAVRVASALHRALVAAAEALAPFADAPETAPPGPTDAPSVPRPTRSRAERSALARAMRPRRRPEPLPPGVLDDSPEAAEHLIRVPRMLALVDGYNVTLRAWDDLPIATQRRRLLDACRELTARATVEVLVVFDGAEEPGALSAPAGRDRVRWRFTDTDVEADDVLLELVSTVGGDRPVVVASSDRRVRDGARQLGVNAISTPQLLAVLRRDPRGGRA